MTHHKGFFITGTGTDVGKTSVTCLLASTLSTTYSVTYMKPIQTGCTYNENHELYAPDFDLLRYSGITLTHETKLHVPYSFEPACSPHLAANLAGVVVSLPHINDCFNTIAEQLGENTVFLVEGAGGAYVPLNATDTMFDLMHLFGLPVIVVVSAGLGTLNHTFLTLEALKSRNIPVAAVVMNNAGNCMEDFMYEDNRAMLRNAAQPSLFLELPYFGNAPMSNVKEFCDELMQQQL